MSLDNPVERFERGSHSPTDGLTHIEQATDDTDGLTHIEQVTDGTADPPHDLHYPGTAGPTPWDLRHPKSSSANGPGYGVIPQRIKPITVPHSENKELYNHIIMGL